MKRYALFASALVVAVLLFMPGTSVEAGMSFPKMDLKMGHAAAATMNAHKGTLKFSELVKERTGGSVNIQVFPAGQLGSEKDILEQVKTGLIHLMFTSPVMIANFDGWGPIGVLSMPYIVKGNTDQEQFENLLKLVRGPLMKEVNEKAAPASNVYALDMGWWFGQRHITTKSKRVTHPDDLKGLKIRTMDTPLARAAFKAVGAVAVPMALGELYTAMQMGVVEGQENPTELTAAFKFYEVQKYLATTGHMTMNLMPICNYKWFQGLSPELREILVKSAMEAGNYQSDLQMKSTAVATELLQKNGVTVTEVNKAEFADKTKDAWKEFEPVFGKGFYEKVKAAN
jgi:TRAP-type transport system periplasmic protein